MPPPPEGRHAGCSAPGGAGILNGGGAYSYRLVDSVYENNKKPPGAPGATLQRVYLNRTARSIITIGAFYAFRITSYNVCYTKLLRASFKKLFDLYSKPLYRFSYSYLKSKEDAEGVVQEVFIKVWNRREQLKTNTSFKSYLT